MGVVVLIACPLDYTLLKLQVSLENQQDASRIDATPSLDGYTYQDWCVWGPGFPRWLEVGKLLDPLKKWLGMVQVYGTKQFLSEALDFDKIVVCFSLFIISRFRALWPITYYAYCLITPQLYPYHTKPYHGRSFRVTLLDIYGAQLRLSSLPPPSHGTPHHGGAAWRWRRFAPDWDPARWYYQTLRMSRLWDLVNSSPPTRRTCGKFSNMKTTMGAPAYKHVSQKRFFQF